MAESTDRYVPNHEHSLAQQTRDLLEFGFGGRRAMGSLTFTGQPTAAQTIILNDGVNTAVTLTAGTDFAIGASAEATLDNLLAAINAYDSNWQGATGCLNITATKSGTTVINLKNDIPGTAGNTTITSTLSNVTVANFTLGEDVGHIDTEMSIDLTGTDINIGSVNLLTAADVQINPSAAYAEDTAHVTADWMTPAGCVRTDTRATLCGTTGDYAPIQLTANGDARMRDDDLLTEVGAIADAAVSGDNGGSVHAQLRGINKRIGTNGDAASAIGTQAAQLREIAENIGSLEVMVWNCEDETAFAAVNDAASISAATEHVTGDQAVNWDKAGTHVNSGISDAFTAIDLSSFGPVDYVILCLNVSSVANIATAVLRLGTDASNYTEWQWDDSELIAGWQVLVKKLSEYTSVTGTGWQQSAVAYGSFHLVFDAAGDVLADITLDHVGLITAEAVISEDDSIHSEDSPHVSGDKGDMILGVRTDTRASLAGTDGDYVPQQMTANGDLRTRDDDANTVLGLTTTTKADVDGNGAVTAHLRRIGFEADRIGDTAGATTDAKADVDGNGTLAAHLRRVGFEADRIGDSVTSAIAAEAAALGSGVLIQADDGTDRINVAGDTDGHLQTDVLTLPVGTALMVASTPVTVATDDTMVAALDAAVDIVAGDTTSIDGKTPALGTAAMVASSPVTIATDDTMTAAANALLSTIDADTGGMATSLAVVDDWDTTLASTADNIDGHDAGVVAAQIFARSTDDVVQHVTNSGIASAADNIDGNNGLNTCSALYARKDINTVSPLASTASDELKVNDASAGALLTTIDADTSKIPAQGTALMAASTPVTIASDDEVNVDINAMAGRGLTFSRVKIDHAARFTLCYQAANVPRLHKLVVVAAAAATVTIAYDDDGAGTNEVALTGAMSVAANGGLVDPFEAMAVACLSAPAGKYLTCIPSAAVDGYAVVSYAAA